MSKESKAVGPKFEYTKETKKVCMDGEHNLVLHRIKALRDFGDVKKGEIGGWINKKSSLSNTGNCWVYDESMVIGDVKVQGDSKIINYSNVYSFNGKVIVFDSVVSHSNVSAGNSESFVSISNSILDRTDMFSAGKLYCAQSNFFENCKIVQPKSKVVDSLSINYVRGIATEIVADGVMNDISLYHCNIYGCQSFKREDREHNRVLRNFSGTITDKFFSNKDNQLIYMAGLVPNKPEILSKQITLYKRITAYTVLSGKKYNSLKTHIDMYGRIKGVDVLKDIEFTTLDLCMKKLDCKFEGESYSEYLITADIETANITDIGIGVKAKEVVITNATNMTAKQKTIPDEYNFDLFIENCGIANKSEECCNIDTYCDPDYPRNILEMYPYIEGDAVVTRDLYSNDGDSIIIRNGSFYQSTYYDTKTVGFSGTNHFESQITEDDAKPIIVA